MALKSFGARAVPFLERLPCSCFSTIFARLTLLKLLTQRGVVPLMSTWACAKLGGAMTICSPAALLALLILSNISLFPFFLFWG